MPLNKISGSNRNSVRTSLDNAQMAVGGDVNPIVDLVNSIATSSGVISATTVSATYLVSGAGSIKNATAYTASTDTTAGWTLANVKTGILAGVIKTTSAAAVTLTLDSVANLITSFAAAGVTIGAGSNIQFIVDNTTGSNTVTVAVDAGPTIAVATPVITGGATLTVSTANKIGLFNLYLSSATAGTLSRII
jgi:hypothetical protein